MAPSGLRIGVDLGGTKVLGVALGPDDRILATHRASTPIGGHDIVDTIAAVVREVSAAVAGEVVSVGVGAAGLVDETGILRFGPNLPGVVDLDLSTLLSAQLGSPVAVDNDATCAAVAEHRLGAAQGVSCAVIVAFGTGIGGALVIDGKIRRGAHHMAGELGHTVVDPSGPRCGCGNRGCWERFASGTALGRMARERAASGDADSLLARVGGELDALDGRVVTAAAAESEPAAVALLDDFARWIALGLAGLVNILDPQRIVVGGGLVAEGDLLLDPVRRHLAEMAVGAGHRPEVEVVPATAGDAAAAVGAALLAS